MQFNVLLPNLEFTFKEKVILPIYLVVKTPQTIVNLGSLESCCFFVTE